MIRKRTAWSAESRRRERERQAMQDKLWKSGVIALLIGAVGLSAFALEILG